MAKENLDAVKSVRIFTDGGAKNNPGPAAIGVVFYIQGQSKPWREYSQFLGELTNNEAEYQAIIFALKKIKKLFGSKRSKNLALDFFSDSKLVVSQLTHKFRVTNPRIQKLFLEVWNKTLDFKQCRFHYIPRAENRRADNLVGQALIDFSGAL